jgi:hypothetical protein
MHRLPAVELWIAFGTGKSFRYLCINDMFSVLGPVRAESLLFFHAFTGCDTVSCFAGHGKKSAWETWNVFPEVTQAFQALSTQPTEANLMLVLPTLERYIAIMYDRTSNKTCVNDARKQLFSFYLISYVMSFYNCFSFIVLPFIL